MKFDSTRWNFKWMVIRTKYEQIFGDGLVKRFGGHRKNFTHPNGLILNFLPILETVRSLICARHLDNPCWSISLYAGNIYTFAILCCLVSYTKLRNRILFVYTTNAPKILTLWVKNIHFYKKLHPDLPGSVISLFMTQLFF